MRKCLRLLVLPYLMRRNYQGEWAVALLDLAFRLNIDYAFTKMLFLHFYRRTDRESLESEGPRSEI